MRKENYEQSNTTGKKNKSITEDFKGIKLYNNYLLSVKKWESDKENLIYYLIYLLNELNFILNKFIKYKKINNKKY